MIHAPTQSLPTVDDRPTTRLPPVRGLAWPTVDPDAAALEAHRALRQRQTPPLALSQRVLSGLRALTVRRCDQCGTEPVARPDLSALTIDGRFCVDCIEACLADTHPDHWCPIDQTGL